MITCRWGIASSVRAGACKYTGIPYLAPGRIKERALRPPSFSGSAVVAVMAKRLGYQPDLPQHQQHEEQECYLCSIHRSPSGLVNGSVKGVLLHAFRFFRRFQPISILRSPALCGPRHHNRINQTRELPDATSRQPDRSLPTRITTATAVNDPRILPEASSGTKIEKYSFVYSSGTKLW
jgi:hypothetical protein